MEGLAGKVESNTFENETKNRIKNSREKVILKYICKRSTIRITSRMFTEKRKSKGEIQRNN